MHIEVISRSKERAGLIEVLAQFYAKELKIQNSKYRLTIYTVSGLEKKDGMRGVIGLIEPGHLSMAVDSRLGTEQMFRTVAHEMVHAKQWVRGQVKQYQKRNGELDLTWMNRKYKCAYYDRPWEIEAYSRESVLANKVLQIFNK